MPALQIHDSNCDRDIHVVILSCLSYGVDVNAVSDDRMNGTQNNYRNPPCRGFNHIMVLLKYIFPFLDLNITTTDGDDTHTATEAPAFIPCGDHVEGSQ